MATHLGYPSVTRRVLEIPEIIELILSYLDTGEKLHVIPVCKKWADIALNQVWKRVDDIIPLLRGLAPMVRNEWQCYDFERRLCASDWETFRKRALRVRSLTYGSEELSVEKDLCSSAFDEIARNRPPYSILPVLLPNLQQLTWLPTVNNRTEYLLMFMHDKIKELTIRLINNDVYPIQSLFEEIRLRMPFLTHLELRFKFPMKQIEGDLVKLLASLTKLKKVTLPVFTITSKIMESLSRLPQLGTIQFEYYESQEMGVPGDIVPFAPQLDSSAFPALWDLSFSSTLHDASSFLKANHAPTNLTVLYVHVVDPATPTDLSQFLSAVAENCHLLTELYIHQTKSPAYNAEDLSPAGDGPTWETLKPILDCPNLVTFELFWDRPLKLTQENIEEVAFKWPSLEQLTLDCDPFFPKEASTLTLTALLPFARHCPNLRELGLYVSAGGEDLDTLSSIITPFKSLRTLNFGLSRVTDIDSTVVLLSQLCPPDCEVICGVAWPQALTHLNEELVDLTREWSVRWEEVRKLLPLVTRVRIQERTNKDMRDKEVESLRERVVSLTKESHKNTETDLDRHSSCVIA
ncbi:hypothetical protein QCA50_014718 [Cerrena zonata]|uniref:F-box domain-containing protein n=1 Tax=Cerrena zonata TaxID=2478898 RepID=A0AAW0FPT1_9APHY